MSDKILPVFGPKEAVKGPKNEGYLEFRVKLGATRSQLIEWADLAIEAGFRPKAQKVFKAKPNGFSGEEIGPDVKGIGKWLREAVIPEYKAHKFEREAKKAEAMRRLEVAKAEAQAAGVREI